MMNYAIVKINQGQLIDAREGTLSLIQICNTCGISPQLMFEIIEEGLVEPLGKQKTTWRFTYEEAERIKRIIRIKDDLKVNMAGAALALHLLDRIDYLESLLALHNNLSKTNVS